MSVPHQFKSISAQGTASTHRADIGEIWRFAGTCGPVGVVIFALSLAACGTAVAPDIAAAGNRGFAGVAASEEPRATMAGRDVILAGGNAADAAAAMGMVLAVTLPSRAGLGGGGACVVHDAAKGRSEVLEFLSAEPSSSPMLARGLAALQVRYGTKSWSSAVAPAENAARFGFTVSKTLADDLNQHGATLMVDATALGVFLDRRRQFLIAGADVRFPQLADTLSKLRTEGATALTSVPPVWSTMTLTDMNGYVLMSRTAAPSAASTGATGFVVGDKNGLAVACELSMGAAFGTGDMANGYLSASRLNGDDLAPMIVKDAIYGQAVLMIAASGSQASALSKVAFQDWLKDAKPYDDVRANLQSAASPDLEQSFTSVLCHTGLGVIGSDCRSLSDLRGLGLGLTFAPENEGKRR